MNRLLLVTATALFMLILVACGQNNTTTPSASAPASEIAVPEPTASASEAASPEASPVVTEEASLSTPEEITVEVEYEMNKVYRIVPIDKEKTNSKVVLLTFDDGPKDSETLDPILDALDKHNAKAIFFVNGYRVKAKPELLKQIDERGQVIGNHSWDHIQLNKEAPEKIKQQIADVQTIVQEVTGKTPVFFRPPHGASNDDVRAIAKENKLLQMNWSNGSLDWELSVKLADRPQAVIDNVMEQLHSGSNILMHELPWTAEIIDTLLTMLEDKGYSFVDPNAILIPSFND
ncbi:MAG: polysaccharide deacetylase family protein [Candidatus Cohnella colombiensis]|uniref:Polysaccharide deacetylase family protein n=1 Tax=Candidatus Cohnella colombiensis TaxID=3121368 RepID=A0AA95EZA5_9BACL|nr:MAG: polysaccharide deacetylase family protein [Cohnella sp.]